MKKVIGAILCFAAILLTCGKIEGQKADTPAHDIQDWAVIAVLLAIGIPLSMGTKNPGDKDQ